jgi:predicted transcriptional regulator
LLAAERRSVGRRDGASGCYPRRMAEASPKDRILEALRDLPSDATIDDAIERLVFLARIEEGLAELDAGRGVPHEEVKRRFGA